MPARSLDDIRLDHQVVADEVPAKIVVGDDAADLGSGEKHILDRLAAEEGFHLNRIAEIELAARAADQIAVALRFQRPPDGGSRQAAMARYVYRCLLVHIRSPPVGVV